MKRLRDVEAVVVHCSASEWGTVDEVRAWHTRPVAPSDVDRKAHPERYGNGWEDVGYHWVVCNGRPQYRHRAPHPIVEAWDGLIQRGRLEIFAGAHVPELNKTSIGVCLIGKAGHFTPRQMARAGALVGAILRAYPDAELVGHCETESGKRQGKTCPDFNMDDFRARVEVGHYVDSVFVEYERLRAEVIA